MKCKTLVWAHRGASAYAPENTLEAFRQAAAMGADGVELDVQMTKDGVLVVIHDETVDRVSDGTGWVKDYTHQELKKLNVNKKFPEYGPQHIPTLAEVYDLLKDTRMSVNVELKTGVVPYPGIEEAVLRLTKDMGMQDRVIYSSFAHDSIRKIRRLEPEAQTGMLYSDGLIGAAEYAKYTVLADALHPALYHTYHPGFFEESREQQLKVHVWTVNEEQDIRYLCENGVEAVITNDPVLAKRVISEYIPACDKVYQNPGRMRAYTGDNHGKT